MSPFCWVLIMTELLQPKELLVVKLGTNLEEANAAAVASVMQAVIAIVEEARLDLNTSDALIVKARPLKGGSLEIPMELVLVTTSLLVEAHPAIAYILEVVSNYIKLKKESQGRSMSMEQVAGSTIFNGNVYIENSTVNILTNSRVNDSFDKASVDIEADDTIKSIDFLKGESRESIAHLAREEFKYLRCDPNQSPISGKSREKIVDDIELVVHTPVLKGNGQWTFIFSGRQIKAKIQDDSFMSRVAIGNERFAAGDRLKVKLLIEEEYSSTLAAYEEKKYVIAVVYAHTNRPSETPLLDIDSKV